MKFLEILRIYYLHILCCGIPFTYCLSSPGIHSSSYLTEAPYISTTHQWHTTDEKSTNTFQITDEENNSSEYEKCYEAATTFVYDNGFCNASDPSNYEIESISYFSCLNRCGSTSITEFTCACDAKCLVYGDCCHDFKKECPDLHTKYMDDHQYLGMNYGRCRDHDYLALSTCKNKLKISEYTQESWFTITTSLTTSINCGQRKQGLKYIFPTYENSVVDLYQGVVFNTITAFNRCKLPKSVPRIIPKIKAFDCRRLSSVSHQTHLMDVLKKCTSVATRDVHNNFRRACPTMKAISCRCEGGGNLRDLLHNVCLGPASGTIPQVSILTLNEEFKKIISDAQQGDFCKMTKGRKVSERTYTVVPSLVSQSDMNNADITMLLETIPKNLAKDASISNLDKNHKNDSENLIVDESTAYEEVEEINHLSEKRLEYRLSISHTIERRLRCPSINSYIFECKLEACAPGAFIVSAPIGYSHWYTGRQACSYPHQASVQRHPTYLTRPVPVCICMFILSLLSEMQMYKVTMSTEDLQKCKMDIMSSVVGPQSLPNYYTFNETPDLPPSPDSDMDQSSQISNVFDRLKDSMKDAGDYCQDEDSMVLKLCLSMPSSVEDICTLLMVGSFTNVKSTFNNVDTVSTKRVASKTILLGLFVGSYCLLNLYKN